MIGCAFEPLCLILLRIAVETFALFGWLLVKLNTGDNIAALPELGRRWTNIIMLDFYCVAMDDPVLR